MRSERFVAYYRVSTARQGRSGLGLDAQRDAVESYLNSEDGELVDSFVEVESGRKDDRPQLEAALSACRVHHATLIIAKLDRLARNVEFIARLMNSNVEFMATDMPKANRLTVHIMAAMAEHEREMISARTKAALAQAKARGVKLGGDRGNIHKHSKRGARRSAERRMAAADSRAADLAPLIEELRNKGAHTLTAIADELNRKGVKTPRGGEWSRSQVRSLLMRIERTLATK